MEEIVIHDSDPIVTKSKILPAGSAGSSNRAYISQLPGTMQTEPFPSLSKYEILGVLGQGSMGKVYKARHKKLGRMVALKVPTRDLVRHPTLSERFLREGQAIAMLQHPHVVRVYDADEEDGLPYIVLEYVEGGPLSAHISEQKVIPLSNVENWAVQMAEALDYIHHKGILHRDLKSSNVLITRDGDARITDFGIAQIDIQQTITNGLLGTPAYMSPEQAKGQPMDHRSDIYSLGVILYECLTGRIPFIEDNGLALIQRIVNDVPAPVQAYRKEVPVWLAQIVERCLEKDPENRVQNGKEVVRYFSEKKENHPGKSIHYAAKRAYLNELDWITDKLTSWKKGISFCVDQAAGFARNSGRVFRPFTSTNHAAFRLSINLLLYPPVLFFIVGISLVFFWWMFSGPVSQVDTNSLSREQTISDSTKVDSSSTSPDRTYWVPWSSN